MVQEPPKNDSFAASRTAGAAEEGVVVEEEIAAPV